MGLVYLGRLSAEADVLPKEAQQSFGLAGPRAKVNVGKEERAVSVRYRGLRLPVVPRATRKPDPHYNSVTVATYLRCDGHQASLDRAGLDHRRATAPPILGRGSGGSSLIGETWSPIAEYGNRFAQPLLDPRSCACSPRSSRPAATSRTRTSSTRRCATGALCCKLE